MDTSPRATFVVAADLQTRTSRRYLGGDQWSEPETRTDLRGTPMGGKAEVWEFDRLVSPERGRGRRRREYVTIMHCPEGWWSTSGSADSPIGPGCCATIMDPQWRGELGGFDRAKFSAFHEEHPVIWKVRSRVNSKARILWYCDAELPDGYRP